MSWLLLAIGAYLILAIVNLADKFLLDKFLPSAKAYTFLVGAMGIVVVVIAPWFLEWPGWSLFLGNILVGALFPGALLLLYKALRDGEASRIITLIGGLVPVFTIVLSLLFLHESFVGRQWMAIFYLILGTIIIAWFPEGHQLWHKVVKWFDPKKHHWTALLVAAGAALVFAAFFVGSKYLYDSQSFFSSFIWIRIGTFAATLLLLIPNKWRREIKKGFKHLKGDGKAIFFSNQALAAIGFLMQNYAIALGSVVLVNALQGVQYAFLMVLGGLVTVFYPKIVKEKISTFIILQKIVAITLISFGLYFIAS